MTNSEFITELKNGIYHFAYIKLDGTKRHARGTLNLDIIKEFWSELLPIPSDAPEPEPTNLLRYFDLDKEGWRSCLISEIVDRELEADA